MLHPTLFYNFHHVLQRFLYDFHYLLQWNMYYFLIDTIKISKNTCKRAVTFKCCLKSVQLHIRFCAKRPTFGHISPKSYVMHRQWDIGKEVSLQNKTSVNTAHSFAIQLLKKLWYVYLHLLPNNNMRVTDIVYIGLWHHYWLQG